MLNLELELNKPNYNSTFDYSSQFRLKLGSSRAAEYFSESIGSPALYLKEITIQPFSGKYRTTGSITVGSARVNFMSFKLVKALRIRHFTGEKELRNPVDSHLKTQNKQQKYPEPDTGDREVKIRKDKFHSGIFTNMWWTDVKAAVGQLFSLQGILCSADVIFKHRNLALPQATVPDIRWIDWAELRRRGFKGAVFDKDNTVTLPYLLTIWAPLKPSLQRCKSIFGEENVAIFSNSAGLYEFDPDGSKAREVEREIGIKVIRHRTKKPAGTAEEIEEHFGCAAGMLVMVGDRRLTDVVYGNRNGFLTILSEPLSLEDEPFVVKQVRKFEGFLVDRWCRKGLKPIRHGLLGDEAQLIIVEDPPSAEKVS